MYAIELALVYAHVLFLPGALVLTHTPLAPIEKSVFAVPLSLGINFFLVVLLVLCGCFQQPVLISIILLEILVFATLVSRSSSSRPRRRDAVRGAIILPAILVLCFLFWSKLTTAFGHVFEHGDSVLSWNRWALEWAAGIVPSFTMNYPQLVPATWATIYVALNEPLQMFARGLAPLFALLASLLVLLLCVSRSKPAFAIAAFAQAVATFAFLGPWLDDGYAETAVLLFSAATLYPILSLRPTSTGVDIRNHVLFSLFAAVSVANTKQAGLYLILIHPILVSTLLLDAGLLPLLPIRRYLAAWAVAVILLVLPWYVVQHWEIRSGIERDIAAYLVGAGGWHGEQSFVERFAKGWHLLARTLNGFWIWLVATGLLLSLFAKQARGLTLIITGPFALIWASSFNYDTRNLALLLPAASIAVVQGYAALVGAIGPLDRAFADRVQRVAQLTFPTPPRRYTSPIGASISLAALLLLPGEEQLISRQAQQGRELGSPGANKIIYGLADDGLLSKPLVTNYRWAEALPGLEETIIPFYRHIDFRQTPVPSEIFADLNSLERYLAAKTTRDQDLLLIRNVAPYAVPEDVFTGIRAGADAGRYRIRAQSDRFLLVRPLWLHRDGY
jgi:hypothetical protein